MKNSLLLKLFFAFLVILVLCEFIEARGVPKRRSPRRRMPHEPFDPHNIDPEDPYDEEEERPPMPPGMMEHSATPKLVKGMNLKGDKGAKEFQEMTDRLKSMGDNIEYDMETAMKRVHRHNKVLEKLRRQKIVDARRARAERP